MGMTANPRIYATTGTASYIEADRFLMSLLFCEANAPTRKGSPISVTSLSNAVVASTDAKGFESLQR